MKKSRACDQPMSSISNTHPKHIFTKKKGFGYAPFGGGEGSRFIMVSLRQAVASNSPPDCCVKMGSTPYLCPDQKIKATQRVAFIFGGGEGSRTPVRKQLGKNFSGRSLLFTFPQTGGNKHPTAFSSFMMHGALKALRTHGLHSDHTRARLVDLPGRMGA